MIADAVVILAMIGMSLWANSRFKTHERLPMQWSLTGKVNWTAPRHLALAFYPGLAVLTATALTILSNHVAPRPGQENEAVYAIPLVMALLFAIQCFHLLILSRTMPSE